MKRTILPALVLFSALGSAYAGEVVTNYAKPRFLLGMGYTSGGDTLATASYTNGTTDSVSAGGSLLLYAGMDFPINEQFSAQTTVGYHFDTTKAATNGSITFSRVPLELLGYFHASEKFRIGGGVRIVNSPKLEGSGLGSGVNASFDNTTGMVIEGEYLVNPKFGIKLRHVSETYRVSGSSVSIDGSHFGILANLYF